MAVRRKRNHTLRFKEDLWGRQTATLFNGKAEFTYDEDLQVYSAEISLQWELVEGATISVIIEGATATGTVVESGGNLGAPLYIEENEVGAIYTDDDGTYLQFTEGEEGSFDVQVEQTQPEPDDEDDNADEA